MTGSDSTTPPTSQVQSFLHSFGYIFLSFSSSISIIFCNKYLYQYYNFQAGTLLMGFHFLFTAVFSYALAQAHNIFPKYKALEMFKMKKLEWSSAFVMGLLLALSVLFNNLSLQFNTIGVYQLSKLVIMPTILGLSYLFYKETASKELLLSVVLIIIGLAITVTAEVRITFFGTFTCFLAILATAIQQLLLQRKNKDLNANPFQLLIYQAPIASVIVLLCAPFIDGTDVIAYDWQQMTSDRSYFSFVLLSCFIAFYVNLGSFLVIGKLSALTYQVVGHSKTIVIIYVGSLIFNTPLNWTQFFGVVIALGGTIYYSYIKMKEQKPATVTTPKEVDTPIATTADRDDVTTEADKTDEKV
ncbi:hypothetical protein C9374_009480 [Naegleria lovaniensis]|uniref:Sugar phosphate transporter domain-containing protein n=1 Tax=Naegleria lovaniensis TaxID=51637 RepID=A0AA88KP80_NAELO|nr:uncharacterized protein C9374_009480 [Naegleria lovaniensis]KAG2392903.1 hypothetical protein C9374_009480 [Naegleria lovaniensis]